MLMETVFIIRSTKTKLTSQLLELDFLAVTESIRSNDTVSDSELSFANQFSIYRYDRRSRGRVEYFA